MYCTLIDSTTLAQHLDDPHWAIVDCRYDLMDPGAGRSLYRAAHVPGAVYAHLDKDLSGPPIVNGGRHPLPTAARLRAVFGHWGIESDTQVVVYDAAGGSFCARAWWLLRYMGHNAVALLDGGWPHWQACGLPVSSGLEQRPPVSFHGEPRDDRWVRAEQVPAARCLIDSRDPARYRGEHEPIDQAAGHIPGALNRYWKDNLGVDGRFLAPAALLEALLGHLRTVPADETVFYCGSGVTACHNLLAAVHAGLPEPLLYAGSWSEWCSDPARPVETGATRR